MSVTSQSSGTVLSADERVLTGFLPLPQWQPFLQAHPDQAFAEFVRRGITHGFRVGFDPINRLKSAPQNFHSVRDNPLIVHKYIADEVAQGRLVKRPGVDIRRNPIGIIPKPHQPGKFRLIVDLSAPRGFSVNDGISPSLCSLDYISVDQAARLIAKCGRGTLMAKTDLQSAYRHVPVHPEDQHLLGLEWDGQIYCDRALPFGLRSAPNCLRPWRTALLGHSIVRASPTVCTTWMIFYSGVLQNQTNVAWHWKKPPHCVTAWASRLPLTRL